MPIVATNHTHSGFLQNDEQREPETTNKIENMTSNPRCMGPPSAAGTRPFWANLVLVKLTPGAKPAAGKLLR